MKKLLTLLSILTLVITVAFCFNASAAEEKVVIDNVVYELISNEKYGEHYAVTDFFENEALAETTKKINIVDEIDDIEVVGIKTNYDDSEDEYATPAYSQKYPTVKEITIPGTIKYINAFSFNFFPCVEKLYLPPELKEIGSGAFKDMESLKTIIIPIDITSINAGVFMNCKSLEKVVFSAKITYIGNYAFSGCESLTSIDFPASLKTIEEGAFSHTAIKKIVIPENCEVSQIAFQKCPNLKKIVFENTNSGQPKYIVIDDSFFDCKNVESIYFKSIPTIKFLINGEVSQLYDLPNLKKIYFAGSEKLWNKLVSEKDRQELEEIGVEIVFYYKHTHSFTRSGDPTCTKGGKFTYSCECGDTQTVTLAKDTNNHSYGSWKVTKKATYAAAGTKQRTCKYCKKVQKATVKKLILGEIENLTATVNGNDVVLNWDALEGATGYRVYMFDKEKNKNVKLASIKGKITYTVSDLEAGETYNFIIKPYNKTSSGTVTWGGLYHTSAKIPAVEEAA